MKHIRILLSIFVLAFLIVSCGQTNNPTTGTGTTGTGSEGETGSGAETETQVTPPTESEMIQTSVDMAPSFIGLTVDEAEQKATDNHLKFRVIEEDGHPLPTTRDLRPGRLNATTLEGKVTFIEVEGEPTVYDRMSWKGIIPETCEAFSDGCNNCVRNPENGEVACTKKACIQYNRPKCLDTKDAN